MIGHKQGSVRHFPSMLLIRLGRWFFSLIFSLPPTSFMPATLALVIFWLCTTVSAPPSSASALLFFSLPCRQRTTWWFMAELKNTTQCFTGSQSWSRLKPWDAKTKLVTLSLFAGFCNLYRLNLANDYLHKPRDNPEIVWFSSIWIIVSNELLLKIMTD